MEIVSNFRSYYNSKKDNTENSDIDEALVHSYIQTIFSYSNRILNYVDSMLVRQIIDPLNSVNYNYVYQQFINSGLPFYYTHLGTELAKRNYNPNNLTVYTGNKFLEEIQLSGKRNEGLLILMESSNNENKKYLCVFKELMDEKLDDNKYFIWDSEIDDIFNNLSWKDVCDMRKQISFEYGLHKLIN